MCRAANRDWCKAGKWGTNKFHHLSVPNKSVDSWWFAVGGVVWFCERVQLVLFRESSRSRQKWPNMCASSASSAIGIYSKCNISFCSAGSRRPIYKTNIQNSSQCETASFNAVLCRTAARLSAAHQVLAETTNDLRSGSCHVTCDVTAGAPSLDLYHQTVELHALNGGCCQLPTAGATAVTGWWHWRNDGVRDDVSDDCNRPQQKELWTWEKLLTPRTSRYHLVVQSAYLHNNNVKYTLCGTQQYTHSGPKTGTLFCSPKLHTH